MKSINCEYCDNYAKVCSNKKIKKSLWGFGFRHCVLFFDESCEHQKEFKRPDATPPPPQRIKEKDIKYENILGIQIKFKTS